MLWKWGEAVQLLPAEAQEYAAWSGSQRNCRVGGVGYDLPAIAGLGLPDRAYKRSERDTGLTGSADGIGRDLVGIGMRGIDHCGDGLLAEEAREALDPAEAADARGQRLRPGRRGSAGQRQRRLEARIVGEESRQRGRFRRAAEDQNAKRHGHGR